MPEPFLQIHNVHSAKMGTPPIVTNGDANFYTGYFANTHGEQWIFTYDRTTKEGVLRGGDCGWARSYPVLDGEVSPMELMLNEAEALWLAACWIAAAS
jgi:hypothetical protein